MHVFPEIESEDEVTLFSHQTLDYTMRLTFFSEHVTPTICSDRVRATETLSYPSLQLWTLFLVLPIKSN